jgi:hypothetical protein
MYIHRYTYGINHFPLIKTRLVTYSYKLNEPLLKRYRHTKLGLNRLLLNLHYLKTKIMLIHDLERGDFWEESNKRKVLIIKYS